MKRLGRSLRPSSTPIQSLTKFQQVKEIDFKCAVAQRSAFEEASKLKKKKQEEYYYMLSFLHFKAIHQCCPEIVKNCIQTIFQLSNEGQASRIVNRPFARQVIAENFQQIFNKKSSLFFKQASALLNQQIRLIVESCKKDLSQQQYFRQNNIQIKVQIAALIFKNFFELMEYIPYEDKESWHFKLTPLYRTLEFTQAQFQDLKKLFALNQPRIQYLGILDVLYNISSLVNACYILLLKQKICQYQIYQEPQSSFLTKGVDRIKNQQLNERNQKNDFDSQFREEKVFLSKLYSTLQGEKKKMRVASYGQFIETGQIYEQLVEAGSVESPKHPRLRYLSQKYKQDSFECYRRFKRYEDMKTKLIAKHGPNLSNHKNAIITKYLIRNPECTYEGTCKTLYMKGHIFIDRHYFENNIVGIIRKEAQYQQMKYFERMFKGISDALEAGISLAYAGSLRLHSPQDHMQQGDPSLLIVATFAGQLMWKIVPHDLDTVSLLQEATKMMHLLQDVFFICFDPVFPIRNSERTPQLQNRHLSFVVPRISAMPDPLELVFLHIKTELDQKYWKTQKLWPTLPAALQEIVSEFDNEKVKEIMLCQWKKVSRLIFNSALPLSEELQAAVRKKLSKLTLEGAKAACGHNRQMEEEQEGSASGDSSSDPQQDIEGTYGKPFNWPNEALEPAENLHNKTKEQLQHILAQLIRLNRIDIFHRPKNNNKKGKNNKSDIDKSVNSLVFFDS